MKANSFNIIVRLQHWMDSVPGQTFLNYAYSWGASIVILGALFKLTHLYGADIMLFIGMGTEVVVFFLSAFDRPFDKTDDTPDLPEEDELEAEGEGTTLMGTDIAEEFSKSIDQAPVFSKLENAIAQMSSSLDHLNGSIDKLNTSGVNEIAGSLDRNIGQQLKAFADTLTKLQNEMESSFQKSIDANHQSAKALNDIIREMKETNKEFIQSMMNMMKMLSDNNRSVDDTAQGVVSHVTELTNEQMNSISEAMTAMKSAIEEMLAKMNSEMGSHAESMKLLLKNLEETSEKNRTIIIEAGKTADRFKEASQPMQNVAGYLDNSVNNMVKANQDFKNSIIQNLQTLKEISDTNKAASADMQSALKDIEKSWHAYENNFNKVGEELGRTFDTLQRGIAGYNHTTSQQLIENLNKFDESISTALSHIAGCNDELLEAAHILADSIKRTGR